MTTTNTTPTGTEAGIDLDKLEALAKAATPGPWAYTIRDHHSFTDAGATINGAGDERNGYPVVADLPPRTINGTHEANASFIAAANPATILALIALARRAAPLAHPIGQGSAVEYAAAVLRKAKQLLDIEQARRAGSYAHVDAANGYQGAIAKLIEASLAAPDSAQAEEEVQYAARYRFLRAGFGAFGPDVDLHNAFVDGNEKMDAAIDAAIRAQSTAAQAATEGDKS
jgi:hypothetical protein